MFSFVSCVVFFWPQHTTRRTSLTRDRTHAPWVEGQRLNHWTTREVLSRILTPGFLNLGTIDILDQIILCDGELSRALQDGEQIRDFYSLNTSSNPHPQHCDHQKCLQTLTNVPLEGCRTITPAPVEEHCFIHQASLDTDSLFINRLVI